MSSKLCNQSTEGLSHALLFYPSISSWWKIYLPILNPIQHTNKFFIAVIKHILKIGNVEECAKFFTIAWSIWERCNKLLYENLHIHPWEVIENALSLHTTYKYHGSLNNS